MFSLFPPTLGVHGTHVVLSSRYANVPDISNFPPGCIQVIVSGLEQYVSLGWLLVKHGAGAVKKPTIFYDKLQCLLSQMLLLLINIFRVLLIFYYY